MDNKASRIEWVDSLKGIAMLGVVTIHAGGPALDGIWGKIGNAGHFGVQMFFVISAFLAWNSLEKGSYSYGTWIKKKLLRLLPLYYIAYAFALTVGILIGDTITFPILLVHVLGIWGLFPKYHNGVLAEWYLGALIIFYVIAPFIFRFVNNIGRALAFVLFSTVFSYCFSYVMNIICSSKLDNYNVRSYIGNTSIWYQLPTLAIGIWLYYIIAGLSKVSLVNTSPETRVLTSVILIVFAFILLVGFVFDKNRVWGFDVYVCYSFIFVLTAVSQFLFSFPPVTCRLFSVIGRYSYPIYLFHFPLIQVVNRIYKSGTKAFLVKALIAVVIPLTGSMLFERVKPACLNAGKES